MSMNTWQDVTNRARMEIEQWFPRQCREPFTDFYWFYMETTPEHDGGFIICKDAPANADYKIASKLGKHLTKDQNLYQFLEVAGKLPILALQRPVDVAWIDDNNGMGPQKLSNSIRVF